jgi:hypothetical protein
MKRSIAAFHPDTGTTCAEFQQKPRQRIFLFYKKRYRTHRRGIFMQVDCGITRLNGQPAG